MKDLLQDGDLNLQTSDFGHRQIKSNTKKNRISPMKMDSREEPTYTMNKLSFLGSKTIMICIHSKWWRLMMANNGYQWWLMMINDDSLRLMVINGLTLR